MPRFNRFFVFAVGTIGALCSACGGTSTPAFDSPDAGGDGGTIDPCGDCAPSSQVPNGTPPQPDSGATTAIPDAGSGYPAPHHPLPVMKNFGGSVLSDIKIVTVTFEGDARRDEKRNFDDTIVASPWWAAVTRGYGINAGTTGGHVELPDDVSGTTLDDDLDLKPKLVGLVKNGTLPPPDANTLYAIYFPSSTTITLMGAKGCETFGAFHDYADFNVGGAIVNGAFAVMPDCGSGFASVSASHEIIEAATDPHPFTTAHPAVPFTWYAYNVGWFGEEGGESADMCEGAPSFVWSGYRLARSWGNAAALEGHTPCQPANANDVYFNASVETEVVQGLHDPSGGPDYEADGFLVAPRGTTKTANVQVFSDAPLPHALKLDVGGRPPSDAAPLPPIAPGVDARLSTNSGKNGTHATLTIGVASTALPGDYKFVVRATLDATTAHEWPVVLRIP